MPSDGEIRAAEAAMLKNDPVAIGMMTKQERIEVAIAALTAAERARENERVERRRLGPLGCDNGNAP